MQLDLVPVSKFGRCFECDSYGQIHEHHVVPRAFGGNRTVPLCAGCHGKVHGVDFTNHGILVAQGIAAARRAGKVLGRPVGSGLDAAGLLDRHRDIVRLLRAGHSVRHTAAISGKSQPTVLKVRGVLGMSSKAAR